MQVPLAYKTKGKETKSGSIIIIKEKEEGAQE